MATLYINLFLKIFLIFTPFFVISAFLSLTKDDSLAERRIIAVKITLAVAISCMVLFFFGTYIFALFGITLDAFRIGAGAVLFLSAVSMIQGKATVSPQTSKKDDVAVVPLAIPITVGPGTIGVLLVLGADLESVTEKIVAGLALLSAVLVLGSLLFVAGRLEKVLGQQGLTILTKLTGLFVSAIAAQIFYRLKTFWPDTIAPWHPTEQLIRAPVVRSPSYAVCHADRQRSWRRFSLRARIQTHQVQPITAPVCGARYVLPPTVETLPQSAQSAPASTTDHPVLGRSMG